MIDVNAKKLISDLKAYNKELDKKIKALIVKIAMEGFKNIAKGSPVDTGMFRSAWIVSFNTKPTGLPSVITSGDAQSALASVQKRLMKLSTMKLGDLIYFINNTSYGIYIEFGSPRQEAIGMVRINTDKMRRKFQEGLKKL